MSVYTRPDPNREPVFTGTTLQQQPAPGLIFRKWQVWDQFGDADKMKRDKSRLTYIQQVAQAVQSAYRHSYSDWFKKSYLPAIEAIEAKKPTFSTVWRLLVGWGENPTMDTGLTLHHLYGFPYIPGSAVKGLLHHIAELEAMEDVNPQAAKPDLNSDVPAWLETLINRLLPVRAIFGSLHLEQGTMERNKKKIPTGPECPKAHLEAAKKNIERQANEAKLHLDKLPGKWDSLYQSLQYLLDDTAGGLVSFYDAVPLPNQDELLQADIVNSHYRDYYDGGKNPPSDDQQPVPVPFLAVSPGITFQFPYRIARWPSSKGRDAEEKALARALQGKKQDDIDAMIKTWLVKGLGMWGIGAKTAAGYGYFDTGIISIQTEDTVAPGARTDHGSISYASPAKPQPVINPSEPPEFTSSINPRSKARGISGKHGLQLWQKLAENKYIERIEGEAFSTRDPGKPVPSHEISPGGRKMEVLYQSGRFFCPVRLTLQGINSEEEAQWLWETLLRPALEGDGVKK